MSISKEQLQESLKDPATHIVDDWPNKRLTNEADQLERFDFEWKAKHAPFSKVIFFPVYRYAFEEHIWKLRLCNHEHDSLKDARACIAHLDIDPKEVEILEVRAKWMSVTVDEIIHTHKGSHSSSLMWIRSYSDHRDGYPDGTGLTPQQMKDKIAEIVNTAKSKVKGDSDNV